MEWLFVYDSHPSKRKFLNTLFSFYCYRYSDIPPLRIIHVQQWFRVEFGKKLLLTVHVILFTVPNYKIPRGI